MANMKLIKMTMETGFVNATHEYEFEMDVEGMTELEIETEIADAINDFIDNKIYVSYEMLDIED